MKICFIANLKNIHSRRWIKPIISNGHEVYLINYRRGATPINGSQEFKDLSTWYQPPKIRFAIWGLWVRKYLNIIKPHILHAHQIQAAGWIGAMSGYHPFVVTTWGSDLLVEPSKSAVRRLLLRTVLSSADHLTVPSELMLKAAVGLDFPAGQVHLIPWGIDTTIFKPIGASKKIVRQKYGLKTNVPLLLSPRRISPICNIEILIAALPKVKSIYPNIQLALIRYNPDPIYLQEIINQINELDLQEHIVWLPPQNSEEDMANIYRMADIVLSIPSSEGYGVSVYEAISTGTPTVISDLPVFDQELIHEQHTLKVPAENIDQTSASIIRLLSDNHLRKELVKNGLESCQKRSSSKRVNRVEELYSQIFNTSYG